MMTVIKHSKMFTRFKSKSHVRLLVLAVSWPRLYKNAILTARISGSLALDPATFN